MSISMLFNVFTICLFFSGRHVTARDVYNADNTCEGISFSWGIFQGHLEANARMVCSIKIDPMQETNLEVCTPTKCRISTFHLMCLYNWLHFDTGFIQSCLRLSKSKSDKLMGCTIHWKAEKNKNLYQSQPHGIDRLGKGNYAYILTNDCKSVSSCDKIITSSSSSSLVLVVLVLQNVRGNDATQSLSNCCFNASSCSIPLE